MDAFDLRRKLISDYEPYMRGFINIRDTRISEKVDQELRDGLLYEPIEPMGSESMAEPLAEPLGSQNLWGQA